MKVVPIKPGVADDTEPSKPNEELVLWLEQLLEAARSGEVRTCLCVYIQDGWHPMRFHSFETDEDLAALALETRRASSELEAEDEED